MSSNRFFSSSTSRFSRGGSSNQDDTLLAPVLDRGGRVPDDVEPEVDDQVDDVRFVGVEERHGVATACPSVQPEH